VIFEALRYVGSERSKAALLKIAQNRQYTDSYALGDRVAKAYMHLAKEEILWFAPNCCRLLKERMTVSFGGRP
jgi:hypothetical protein